MKALLVKVSSLGFCAILLCFFAYATDRLSMPKSTQQTPVAASLQQGEIQVPTVEADSLCSPCVERMVFIREMVEQEWEEGQASRLENTPINLTEAWERVAKSAAEIAAEPEKPLTPEVSTVESIETQLKEQLLPERFDKAQQLIDQYGVEEGLRRLHETDPDAARQFERAQRERKMNTEP